MKKILFPAICLMMTICLQAQTNFREISFDQAIAAAKAENKLVFVDVMTSWCGPCKRMASDVFPQKMVGDFMNQHFVNIKIDAEKNNCRGKLVEISTADSKVKVYVIPTNEELLIARDTLALISK